MQWSPDGAWILYSSLSHDQSCAVISASSSRRYDAWVVRADSTDAHEIAPFAFPMEWSDDSRSVLVESQLARPDAPLGGVLRAFVDGRPTELVYPYAATDDQDEHCHIYGVATKAYRGSLNRR